MIAHVAERRPRRHPRHTRARHRHPSLGALMHQSWGHRRSWRKGMRRDVWPRPVRCSLRSTFSLGARRIAVAAAAASARYSLVTADEPYMTRRRNMARWDTILGILARCGPHDWTVGRSVCGHAWCIPCAAPFMLRSPPRYSGARRPVPRVLILDSSLRVGLGRRREAESIITGSDSVKARSTTPA